MADARPKSHLAVRVITSTVSVCAQLHWPRTVGLGSGFELSFLDFCMVGDYRAIVKKKMVPLISLSPFLPTAPTKTR